MFDLGRVVNVTSATVKLTGAKAVCPGQVRVSSDGSSWTVMKNWTSLGSFSASNLGNLRYALFNITACPSYNVIMDITGTYKETITSNVEAPTNYAAASEGGNFFTRWISGWFK